MGLETATYISGLNASNPVNATDVVGEGDDHLRLIKSTLLNTFPNLTGAMTRTQAQLNNALIKTESNNIISNGDTPADPCLALETTRPVLVLDDTNAAVDEGRYYIHSSAGQLALVAINDANSSSQNGILIDRTGINVDSIQLYVDNVVCLEAIGNGISRVRSDGNTDAEARGIYLSHQNGTLRGQMGFIADTSLRLLNNMHGGAVLIQGEDAGGVTRNILNGDPDGETSIYYNGTLRAQAGAGLFRIRSDSSPGIGSTQSIHYLIEQADGVDLGRIGFPGVANLTVDNFNHGSNVQLRSEDAGGSLRTLFDGDPDGRVDLYYDGSRRIATNTSGLDIFSAGSTDTEQRLLVFNFADFTDRAQIGHRATADFAIRNMVHGGGFVVTGEDAGGTGRSIVTGDPDGAAFLYHVGVSQIATQDNDGTGITSGAEVKDHVGTFRDVGFNVLPIFNDDASDTLEANHCGKMSLMEAAADITLTLEANTSTDFPVEGVTHIFNGSAANDYIVTEGTGVTLYYVEPGGGAVDTTGGATVGPGGMATIWRRSSTVYWIWGSEISYTP